MSEFSTKVKEWEKTVEDLCISMMSDKDDNGIAYMVDVMPIISTFNHVLAEMKTVRVSQKYRIIPGKVEEE